MAPDQHVEGGPEAGLEQGEEEGGGVQPTAGKMAGAAGCHN